MGVCAEREESQDKTVLSIHTWSGFSSGAEYYTSKEPFQPLTLYRAVLPQVPRSSSTFLHSSTGKFLGLHLPFCLTFSRSVGGLVRHVKLYTFYINHQLEHPPVSNSKPWPIGPSEVHEEVSIWIIALLSILLRFFWIFVELTCISRTPLHGRHIRRINVLLD